MKAVAHSIQANMNEKCSILFGEGKLGENARYSNVDIIR